MRISWVLDGRLAASGLIGPDDAESLAENGVRSILSLTSRSPFPDGPPDGFVHLHVPITDMSAPLQTQIDDSVAFIRSNIEADRPVLVHCWAGLGRTGTILGCFLVAEGRDPEQAIADVRAARPGAIETWEQEACVRNYRPGAAR